MAEKKLIKKIDAAITTGDATVHTAKKRSFGKDKSVSYEVDATGLPIIIDTDMQLITGIPRESFFPEIEGIDAKVCAIAYEEYRIAVAHKKIMGHKAEIADLEQRVEEHAAKIEEIKTGKKSKSSIEAQERALLKKLEALKKQKETL